MLEFLAEYGLFLAKVATVAIALVFIMASAANAAQRSKEQQDGHILIKNLNERHTAMRNSLREAVLSDVQFKQEEKARHKEEKRKHKDEKKALKKKAGDSAEDQETQPKRLYVLDFNGDMQASAVGNLREEVSAVLTLATPSDEVLVRLESPGGLVHGYGLAASQLERVKQREIPLTVCVDKVAASGGYMMACLADRIVAAPFAVLGSIGVVAQIPNFHRLLKKHDVDMEVLTAGEYKRTLTLFGENTEKGREKFLDELEQTHGLFKDWVGQHRPELDIAQVATGESWYGSQAMEKGLADELRTSDDYITAQVDSAEIFQIRYEEKKSLQQKFGMAATDVADNILLAWWQRLNSRWF